MRVRFYRSDSHYPAYDHTSYNATLDVGRTNLHLSLHWKHAWGDGGFWLGLRPEFELRRNTDRVQALREQMRSASMLYTCAKCHCETWGDPGLRRPAGWEFIHRMDFCDECVSHHTFHELLS